MKKTIRFMLYAAATAVTVSCAEEIIPDNSQNNNSSELVPMTFMAGAEDSATKVVLQEDRKTIHWESTDMIKVFDGTSNDLPAFTTTGSGLSVDFSGGVADADAGTYYALYPYQEGATFKDTAQPDKGYGKVIKATVPPIQTAVPNGIHPEAFVAAAKSENGNRSFLFRPICGFIKFQLSEADATDAEAISLSGNDLGSLAGSVEIFFQDNSGEAFGQTYVSNENTNYVTLTGNFEADTDYYFAIRSNSFAKGFTMTIRYKDGSSKHVTTNKAPSKSVSRNTVMNIGTPVFTEGLPNDLYIAWQHGLDIYIADERCNKNTHNGNVVLINEKTKTKAIGDNATYFIEPGLSTDVILNKSNHNKLIICSRYLDTRVKLNNNAKKLSWAPSDGKEYILVKNIEYVNAEGYNDRLCSHNADGKFNVVAFDNCSFTLPAGKAFDYMNAKRSYNKMIITGCDFKLSSGTGSYILGAAASDPTNKEIISNFIFTNNIVYSPEGDHTGFYVYKCKYTTLTNLVVKNNLFYNVYCSANGYAYAAKNEYFDMQNNIFYIPNYGTYAVNDKGETQWWGFLRMADKDLAYYPQVGKATATNNYAYRTTGDKNFKTSHTDMKDSNSQYYTGVSNPVNGDVDPFENKNFVNLSFTLKSDYAQYIGPIR